jgi:competence protein ComEC
MKRWIFSTLAAVFTLAAPAAAQPDTSLRVSQRAVLTPPGFPRLGPRNRSWMAAHFINVGQGAATLLEFSCGLVLIDTGGGAPPRLWTRHLTDYLDGIFARRPDLSRTIDLVVFTHPHSDHTTGAPALADPARYTLRHIVTNAQTAGSGIRTQNQLIAFAAANGIGVTRMDVSQLSGDNGLTSAAIDPLRCTGDGDPDIRLLWGSEADPATWPSSADGNDKSVVVRVAFGESSFLIVGDLEDTAQRAMLRRYAANPAIFDVDIYEAGHHGSRNGTTGELVAAMTPEIAVIETGNPSDEEPDFAAFNFGHPNRDALALLTDPSHGVSLRRPVRHVAVGIRGRPPSGSPPPQYEFQDMDRAIFATGWDGNIIVYARRNGEKRVLID